MRGLPSPFDSDPRPLVAVFRSPVFNASETFVAAQAGGLVRYQPLMLGLEGKGHVPAALNGRVMLASRGEALALRFGGSARGLAERVRPYAPVLVHAHFGPDGVLAMPLARRLGVPLVTSLRGYDVTRTRGALLRSGRASWVRYALMRGRLAREGALFLAVSEALRARAIAAGFPEGRTLTHYNGVDLARFRVGERGAGLMVLHVGRLVEKKGTAVLLRAFAQVHGAFPSAELAIVGEGPLRASLEGLAGELGLGEAVRFVGHAPAGEWMRRAALLAAPSVTAADGDAEGLPNVVVEAAASGLAVLGSDHSGIPEAIDDGRSGFVVPEGAVEPLAARLAELLGSAELRARMGAAGRTMVEAKFDAARQMARLEAIYDGLRV
jgi:glycosyltransferase involved in cell wall biosynthesis